MGKLDGKVAVVTGASRGIGRAIAAKYAGEGALVCVNYRENAEAAAEAVRLAEAAGGEAFAIQADVSVIREIARFFEELDAELARRRGDRGFDILVNNAGIGAGGTTAAMTEEDFDRVFRVNVKGPIFTTQHAIPRLRDGGRVLNISSGLSRMPMPIATTYAASKGALNVFTVALAGELGARKITVNTLSPGLVATDFNAAMRARPGFVEAYIKTNALGRIGEVEDIAGAALALALPESGYITGQYVEASGGLGLVRPLPL